MNLRTFFGSLIFCFFVNPATSQDLVYLTPAQTDSIQRVYFSTKGDLEEKIQIITKINNYYGKFSDTLLREFDLLLQKANTDAQRFRLHYEKGVAYHYLQQFAEAEKSLDQAYHYKKANKDIDVELRLHQVLGGVKNILGKNPEAKRIYLEGISVGEKANNPKFTAYLYLNLGNLEADLGRLNEADKYYQKAVEYSIKAKDNRAQGSALMSLGITALDQGQLDTAEKYLTEAISVLQKNTADAMNAKNNLGIVYEEMGKYQEAQQIYLEVMDYYQKENNQSGLANVNFDLGLLQQKLNNFGRANQYCTESLNINKNLGNLYGQLQALKCLYQTSEKDKNYEKAYGYFRQYSAAKDSLISEKKIEQLTEIKKEFEFKAEKEKIELAHQATLQQEKMFQKFLGLAILLLSGLLFFAYRAYSLKAKTTKIITRQKEEIEKYYAINENLIFSLSHDIKEPMLGIQLLLDKLNYEDPYLHTAAEGMRNQIASINGILANLLQIKRDGVIKSAQEFVDLETVKVLIQQLVNQLQFKLEEKNLLITQHFDPSIEKKLPISQQKLYLTLLNLLTNAIKHSPSNAEIQIIVDQKGIYVRDFGDGIDPLIMEKIGKEVFAANDSSNSSGMGLLLKANILEDSGVRISAKNLPDGGAKVGIVWAE